jgi:hypothetical protein
LASAVVVVLLEEAAAAARVDLVGRLVAIELVFSDMRERNDKEVANERENRQTAAQIIAWCEWLAELGKFEKIPRGRRGKENL